MAIHKKLANALIECRVIAFVFPTVGLRLVNNRVNRINRLNNNVLLLALAGLLILGTSVETKLGLALTVASSFIPILVIRASHSLFTETSTMLVLEPFMRMLARICVKAFTFACLSVIEGVTAFTFEAILFVLSN